MMASATVATVLVFYLAVLLGIGWWGGRDSGEVSGYYVAGKKLPSWVIAFSSNATGESAWLLLGLTGMGYLAGAHAFWVILGELGGVTMSWVLVARPFKEYTDRYDSITVPDFLEDRFRDSAHVLRIVSAIIIFSMATVYVAAQLTASGRAFESFLGTTYEAGVLIGAAIVLYYTTIGGFKAVAYSDVVQGVLMVACLILLPIVGIVAAGGWTELTSALQATDPAFLRPMGTHGLTISGIASAAGFVAIGFAFLGSPHLLTRFISARHQDEIADASPIAVLCMTIFIVGAILTGMAGRAVFPGLDDPETIYPVMGTELFPAFFTGIFLVVLLAAIMSTVDSLLILASSAVVRDVIQKTFNPPWSQAVFSRWGKLTTVVIGAGAVALALPEVRAIFWFVLFAWSGLASAFTPVVLCSLFWRRTTRAGAIAGMIAGFVGAVGWVLFFKAQFYDFYEMIPGFALGFAATVSVSLFTSPPSEGSEEFDSVWRAVGRPSADERGRKEGDGRNPTMRNVFAQGACTLLTGWLIGCADSSSVEILPGVALELAEHRTATISDLRYNLRLVIPQERSAPVRGRVIASFALSEAGPLVFDFAQPRGSVSAVRVAGEPVAYEVRDEHIVLSDPIVDEGQIAVEIEFAAGDGSLNRQDDFLYALFVPDRARVAFPVFDQPNLKARFALELEVPVGWRAVANGSVTSQEVRGEREVFRFAETPPISSYLFSFAAGAFEVEFAERAGRRMAMYHRETETERITRNRDAIFDLHASALEWLEDYTGIPYPFEKFDFVLIPAFQFGGMEHPGAILYRAEGLLLDESVTQNQLLGRASLIAHETAHQWFGDLVTMEWFSDVWMKETLANFLAAKIVNPPFPDIDHDLRFLLAHYPAAYAVDRTDGTHPIRQPLENLNEAGTLYGAIIYQKAPIVLKHLERLVGEDTLRDGLREYLESHRYGNATWSDLIRALDRRSDEDLEEWSRVWVEEPGRPRIEVVTASAGQTLSGVSVRQTDPFGEDRVWTQRLSLLMGYGDGTRALMPVELREARVDVPDAVGRPMPDYILANGGGVGYGLMALDAQSRDYLLADLPTIDHALSRAIAWISLWEALLEGSVDPEAFLDLAERALLAESEELNVEHILGYLTAAFWRHMSPDRRRELVGELEAFLWRQTEAAGRPSLATAYFGAYRDVALTEAAMSHLERIWRGEEDVPGVPLSERDLTTLAQSLALRAVEASDSILAEQRSRIDNPDRQAEFDFVAPALSDDRATRDAFFASLSDPANRARESWVVTSLRFLHHPLRARESEDYIRPSLDLLEEIQRTGDVFFPQRWLGATLAGHQTASAVASVHDYLDERPDLAPRLRGKVLQSADGLVRAARILEGQARVP